MSGTYERDAVGGHAAEVSTNVGKIAGIGTALVLVNVLLIWGLSYTPLADVGLIVFSNFFTGILAFAVTVGGGRWIATTGIEKDTMMVAAAGVALTQGGYALFGGAVLSTLEGTGLVAPALAITAVLTAGVTALAVVLVYKTDRSFERWNYYSMGCFVLGIVSGAVLYFVSPALLLLSSVFFFLGFVTNLVYEIWAVRENRYASDLRNAVGIYVAVMGVFVNILLWVVRLLSILSN